MHREQLKLYFEKAYWVCFGVGVQSIRCLRSLVRFTRLLWVPIAHALRRVLNVLLLRHLQRVGQALVRLWRSWREGTAALKKATDRKEAAVKLLRIPSVAVRHHRTVFRAVANTALPALALLLLLLTVRYWLGADFALSLEYAGENIGYIRNESVYATAAQHVREAVINANDAFVVEQAPQMRVHVKRDDMRLLTDHEVSRRILKAVDGELTQAAGLYVDGAFRGAVSSRADLDRLIDRILSGHKKKGVDGVGFFEKTEIVEGRYPVSALVDHAHMTATLKTLTVATMVNFEKTESVKYITLYQQNPDRILGTQKTITEGKNGEQRVFGQKIYVNGVKQYEVVLRTETIKQPVKEIIEVGAQTYSDDVELGDGVATGKFVWPLPYTKQISSYFATRWGRLHGAIDIANGSTDGKPIIASDGGVVIEAQMHSSWGLYVLIDHGNGFKTRYAHCSKLNVEAGDKVAQGQYIGNVGETGYATGPHLHFEVIENGVLVDPLKHVQR